MPAFLYGCDQLCAWHGYNESVSACIHDFVEVWVNGNEAYNETLMDKQFWSSNLCLRKDAIKKFRNFQVNKNMMCI